MLNFIFGCCFEFFIFEPILLNFVYLCNIDLFLDLILFPKKKYKLIKHILKHYYIDEYDVIMYH